MATYRITAPDGSQYTVTGDGTEQEALAHFQETWQQEPAKPALEPTRGRYTSQKLREKQYRMENPQPMSPWDMGTPDMGEGIVGIGEAALSLGSGAVATPVAGLAGLAATPFSRDPAALIESIRSRFTYAPRTQAGEQANASVSYPFEKLAQGADAVGDFVRRTTGSPALATAANVAIQSLPAAVGKGVSRAKVGNGRSRPADLGPNLARSEGEASIPPVQKARRDAGLEPVRSADQPPTLEQLRELKNAAYKKAEQTGVVVSRSAVNRFKVELVNELKKEGVNRKLHPKASAALEEIVNTTGQLSLSQIETLRKIANDAKTSIEPADARLGGKIVEKIDDFEESLSSSDVIAGDASAATAFKEARALNTRYAKTKVIEKIFDDAKLQAGANYTVSGMENALRQQFKALAKNERKMKGFTPEETAAIRKVAMGGPMENALRYLGKLAPNGVLSNMLGLTAVSVAGPGGILVPAVGAASKYGATRMTMKNATKAGEIVRRGPQKKPEPARVPEEVK